MRSLRSQLLLTHLAVAVVAIGLVGVLSSQLFRHYYVAQTKQSLRLAAEDLAISVARAMQGADGAREVALVTAAASRALRGRVCVFDAEKAELVASSDLRRTQAGPETATPECEAESCARIESTEVTCHPGPVISVVAPITDSHTGRRLGVLLLRRPLGEVEATLRLSAILVGLSGACAAALAFVLAALASRAIARPLATVAQTASRLAQGDFAARVDRTGPLELRTMAGALNHMAEALASAFAELSGERERLADILASMDEGVVSLTADGRIALANAAAGRLLTADGGDVTGLDLPTLLARPDLASVVDQVLSGERPAFEQVVQIGQRTLRLHGSRVVAGQGGAVVVIADVTEAERLERLRREFVANASHELRAPLTSIQGFLGAVADGTAESEEQRQRCLRLAAEEAERMRRLVDQLLDLSRLQAQVAPLDRQPLDLRRIAEAAVEVMAPQAQAKSVILRLEADPVPPVHGDGDRLMQVLVNLVDNAVRFSPPAGEVLVQVRQAGEDRVEVTVRDRGPGIPETDLLLVWERFHKADRSRQRSQSGAGLGLAIAREIVLAHGGGVRAQNAPEGGAVLSFTLPTGQ